MFIVQQTVSCIRQQELCWAWNWHTSITFPSSYIQSLNWSTYEDIHEFESQMKSWVEFETDIPQYTFPSSHIWSLNWSIKDDDFRWIWKQDEELKWVWNWHNSIYLSLFLYLVKLEDIVWILLIKLYLYWNLIAAVEFSLKLKKYIFNQIFFILKILLHWS